MNMILNNYKDHEDCILYEHIINYYSNICTTIFYQLPNYRIIFLCKLFIP